MRLALILLFFTVGISTTIVYEGSPFELILDEPVTLTPNVTGEYPTNWTATGPNMVFVPGLAINETNGVITGAPTSQISPSITYNISAVVNTTTVYTSIMISVFPDSTTTFAPLFTTLSNTTTTTLRPYRSTAISGLAITLIILSSMLILFFIGWLIMLCTVPINKKPRYI